MKTSKIAGIGLSRTGTTSLVSALKQLGIASHHTPRTLKNIHDAKAVADLPVPLLYDMIDTSYPGSRFILTTRDRESWLHSMHTFFMLNDVQFTNLIYLRILHERVYGSAQFDRIKFSSSFDRYHEEIQTYFQGRESDLLILNLKKETRPFETLASFLGCPTPDCSYPKSNPVRHILHLSQAFAHRESDLETLRRVGGLSEACVEWLRSLPFSSDPLPLERGKNDRRVCTLVLNTLRHTQSPKTTASILDVQPDLVNHVRRNALFLPLRKWVKRKE